MKIEQLKKSHKAFDQLRKNFKYLLEKDVKLELEFLSTRSWIELEDADKTFEIMASMLQRCEKRVIEEMLQDCVRTYRYELEKDWGIK